MTNDVMTNNELLLAISNMMDSKLKSELQPIKNELRDLKSDVQTLKADVQELKVDVQNLKVDVQNLKADVQNLKADVQELKAGQMRLELEIHGLKLYQENVILPRLNTIEACYTDTFKRYQRYTDKIESMFEDTELLKSVVTEHSVKLQKLA